MLVVLKYSYVEPQTLFEFLFCIELDSRILLYSSLASLAHLLCSIPSAKYNIVITDRANILGEHWHL